jgi:hypothetical protein
MYDSIHAPLKVHPLMIISQHLPFPGLTSDHLFDEYYSAAAGDITNRVFHGFNSTRIFFDTNSVSWKIVLIYDPEMYAEMESEEKHQDQGVPLGTQRFKHSAKMGGDMININMNVCNDEKEFNCQDGACIQIDER